MQEEQLPDAEIVLGLAVYTADGEHLGSVKEVRGDVCKVDVPLRPDYWLQVACLDRQEAGRYVLRVARDDLDECRAEPPGKTVPETAPPDPGAASIATVDRSAAAGAAMLAPRRSDEDEGFRPGD